MKFIKRTTAVILAVGIMTTPQALAVEREPFNFEGRSYGFESRLKQLKWAFRKFNSIMSVSRRALKNAMTRCFIHTKPMRNRNSNPVQRRVEAVTDFVAYAREQMKPYDVDISVDIFGYAATLPEAPGIGQNFLEDL